MEGDGEGVVGENVGSELQRVTCIQTSVCRSVKTVIGPVDELEEEIRTTKVNNTLTPFLRDYFYLSK